MLDTHPTNERPLSRAHPPTTFLAYPNGHPLKVVGKSQYAITLNAHGQECGWWHLEKTEHGTVLDWAGACAGTPGDNEALALIESLFSTQPLIQELVLAPTLARMPSLMKFGLIPKRQAGPTRITQEAFFQISTMWLGDVPSSYPVRYVITDGRRHPIRPDTPSGIVYQRYLPWLQRTFNLRVVEVDRDLERFNRWMNDPVVAHFWQEEGDLDQHRARLERTLDASGIVPLIGYFDDEPFGYFETYWAKEDRIAPYYDADDFDRGWHVLIGEPKFRGRPYVAAWMPSISHYLFLDDCRTQRLIIEPRADNTKMIHNLSKSGYALLKEFEFPHKRAMLGMLLRERFFTERCWIPAAPHPGAISTP